MTPINLEYLFSLGVLQMRSNDHVALIVRNYIIRS